MLWIYSIHGLILITLWFPETCPWNSVEMCRMTLVVLWTNFTHRFSLITLLLQKKCSRKITLVVLCTKYTYGFILITVLFQEKCPWNSVKMCSMALVVLSTNSTHGFTLMTLLFRTKSSWHLLDMCRTGGALFPEKCPWNSVELLFQDISPWNLVIYSNNSFISKKMSLDLSGDV